MVIHILKTDKYEKIHHTDEHCVCPVPCKDTMYETDVTYATSSSRNSEHFLESQKADNLREKNAYAQEILQRVDHHIIEQDIHLNNEFQRTHSNVSKMMEVIKQIVNSSMSQAVEFRQTLEPRLWFHYTWGIDKVKYIIHHDFIRGYNVMEERTFDHVATGYNQVRNKFEKMLNITTDPNNSESVREIYYILIKEDLQHRITIAERAFDNITEVYEAYQTGTPILTYKTTYERRYDMAYIPLALLYHDDAFSKYYNYLVEAMNEYFICIATLLRIAEQAYINRTYVEEEYKKVIYRFEYRSRSYLFRKYLIKDRIIYKSEDLMNERIEVFQEYNSTFYNLIEEYNTTVAIIQDIILNYENKSFKYITEGLNMSTNYLNKITLLKKDVAEHITSHEMDGQLQATRNLFKDLRSRVLILNGLWLDICETYRSLWRNMLDEFTTIKFYTAINEDFHNFVNNETMRDYLAKTFDYFFHIGDDVIKTMHSSDLKILLNADFIDIDSIAKDVELEAELSDLTSKFAILNHIAPIDGKMEYAIEELQSDLQAFQHSMLVDSHFIK